MGASRQGKIFPASQDFAARINIVPNISECAMKKMKSSVQKGEEFELEVKRIIEGVIAKAKAEFRAEVVSHPLLIGFSAEWQPDLVLMAESLLYPSERSLELAIVECKYIGETAREGTYWTQMSRAYMSLNDLRHVYREDLSFYLAVNRYSKGMKRDYSKIFRNIGVNLLNINVPEECVEFENNIKRLLEGTTFKEQEKKLKRVWEEYR